MWLLENFFCFVLFLFYLFFNWSLVDLQCCVNFCCTAKWFSYLYIYIYIYTYIYIYMYIYTFFFYILCPYRKYKVVYRFACVACIMFILYSADFSLSKKSGLLTAKFSHHKNSLVFWSRVLEKMYHHQYHLKCWFHRYSLKSKSKLHKFYLNHCGISFTGVAFFSSFTFSFIKLVIQVICAHF